MGGSGRGAALERLGIKDLSTIDALDHIAVRIIECLGTITQLASAASEELVPTPPAPRRSTSLLD